MLSALFLCYFCLLKPANILDYIELFFPGFSPANPFHVPLIIRVVCCCSEGCLGARGSRGAGTPLIANGNGCLIENVVGNWVPNRSGTYSPFPGVCQDEEQPGPPPSLPTQPPVRKQRIVAEVFSDKDAF